MKVDELENQVTKLSRAKEEAQQTAEYQIRENRRLNGCCGDLSRQVCNYYPSWNGFFKKRIIFINILSKRYMTFIKTKGLFPWFVSLLLLAQNGNRGGYLVLGEIHKNILVLGTLTTWVFFA